MAKGVTKIPERYRARVKFMGKYVLLGNFLTEEVAEEKVRAAEKAIKLIESTASRSFDAWLGLPQVLVPTKPAKPLTKAAQKDALLDERLEVAVYMRSLMNYKGPEPVLAWGLDKLEEYILANRALIDKPTPAPVTEAAWVKQIEKLKEELSEADDGEYGEQAPPAKPKPILPPLKDVWTDEIWFEARLEERGGSLGKDKWGNTLIDGNRDQEPVIGFDKDGYYVEQNDEYNKIGEVMFKTLQEVEAYEAAQVKVKVKAKDEEIEDGEYGDHEGEQAPLPIYIYDFDKTATDSDGECYLIDNYETTVDPDYPEYMTWINKRGVAEFKTEY